MFILGSSKGSTRMEACASTSLFVRPLLRYSLTSADDFYPAESLHLLYNVNFSIVSQVNRASPLLDLVALADALE